MFALPPQSRSLRFQVQRYGPFYCCRLGLHIVYKICLASAYARGEFGQAFPLSRGMVLLFATFIAFVSLGQVPSPNQSAGIVLVGCGLSLLALDKLRGVARWPLLLAAASAVASYSVIDAYGTRRFGNWSGFTA